MKNPSDSPPKSGAWVYIPPKVLLVVVAVFLGSGAGVGGVTKFLNGSGDDKGSHKGDKGNSDEGNKNYNVRFQSIESTQKIHTQKIGALETKTNDIQTVQHGDIARTEARRLTEDIKNRDEREREYDRLVDLNIKRLKENDPPCSDRRCRD
jgi:hypothetical protein